MELSLENWFNHQKENNNCSLVIIIIIDIIKCFKEKIFQINTQLNIGFLITHLTELKFFCLK